MTPKTGAVVISDPARPACGRISFMFAYMRNEGMTGTRVRDLPSPR
jgi:hypothetical protein